MRERKMKRAVLSVGYMSADEKRAMMAALECLRRLKGPVRQMEECLADIGLAMQRTRRREVSDAKTDAARRVTVGARVRKEDAARYRACAQFLGLSMYRFVVLSLDLQAARVMEQMERERESLGPQCSQR